MARGWESKSVEAQQEERAPRSTRDDISPEELERVRRREGLELSRRRVERELAETRSDLRKTSLEHALRHLQEELNRLV